MTDEDLIIKAYELALMEVFMGEVAGQFEGYGLVKEEWIEHYWRDNVKLLKDVRKGKYNHLIGDTDG